MSQSNLAALTKSHSIVAAKKRARKEQIKEVVFDEAARREYLTGFHKRKVEKTEAKKKAAIERDKQQRLEARREHRQLLAEQAVKNARQVEKAYGAEVSEDDWNGLSSRNKGKGRAEEHEEEYEGEEQLATVTIVEDFDPDALLHGPSREKPTSGDSGDEGNTEPLKTTRPQQKPPPGVKKAQAKTSVKAKSVKYQTNAARKVERSKQLRRKGEKAQRAGGKGARKGGKRK
ncbi:hypothetical protein BDY19DRAFT_883064 [Irpex rosettiformis]|uniref:Uncharacterized protein n=1 Tax=Irpex rosettiformis TaxID=378272 RepID=A0ACB8UGK2_9APHY|nr:hypothetical protein BDY19DRAFT_883064 [Irpex rosettiformis]